MHAHRQRNGTQRTQNRIGIAGQSESTTRKRSEKVAETSGTKERRDTTKNGTRKKATRITAEEKLKTTRKPERREIKTEREREEKKKQKKRKEFHGPRGTSCSFAYVHLFALRYAPVIDPISFVI